VTVWADFEAFVAAHREHGPLVVIATPPDAAGYDVVAGLSVRGVPVSVGDARAGARGPYHGQSIRYRRRPALRGKRFAGKCVRCGEQTIDPGDGGWFYRRSELGQPMPQLCAGCGAVLQRHQLRLELGVSCFTRR
jgi:hypothetical protein